MDDENKNKAPDNGYRMKPLEEEAENYAAKRIKTQKIIKRVIIWSVIIVVLTALLTLALSKCDTSLKNENGRSFDPLAEDADYGEGFYPADINHDIFEDDNFKDKNREIYIDVNGNGRYYDESNISGASSQAKLFYAYITAATNGDGKTLNTLFTEDYFKNRGLEIKPYADKFPMQKIYNVEIKLVGSAYTQNTVDGVLIAEYYKVSFLLLENNGTFRPDVPEPENGTAPMYFEVLTLNNESAINRIYKQIFADN